MNSVYFQGKPFNITVIQVCVPASNAEEAEVELFYEDVRRRQWQPTPVLLPGKSHGERSLVDYSPWDRKELDMTERLHFIAFRTLLLTMMATPFLLRDSCPQ